VAVEEVAGPKFRVAEEGAYEEIVDVVETVAKKAQQFVIGD
jgi:hypothetical protein